MSDRPEEVLRELERQLNCSVCLERFKDPKALPCLHSFCTECLVKLLASSGRSGNLIRCPNCRREARLPDGGISGLPSAFHVNYYLELLQVLKKVSGTQRAACDNCNGGQAIGYCRDCAQFLCQECIDIHRRWARFSSHAVSGMRDVASIASRMVPLKEASVMDCLVHNKKPLEIFCEKCEVLLCHNCTVKTHRDHEYDLVMDVFAKYKQRVEDHLQPVKEKLVVLDNALAKLKKRKSDVVAQGEDVKLELRSAIQELMQILQDTAGQLSENVDVMVQEKMKQLDHQIGGVEMVAAQLQSCKEFVEAELRMGSEQQILAGEKQMVQHMITLTTQVVSETLEPLVGLNIGFIPNQEVYKLCREVGIVTKSIPKKSITIGNDLNTEGTTTVVAGSKASFELQISPKAHVLPPSCHLFPVDKHASIPCSCEQLVPGKYQITYTPQRHGLHKLKVEVDGARIPGSPFVVFVLPYKPKKIMRQFNWPCGAAASKDGSLVVSEWGKHCVTVVSPDGLSRRSFGRSGTDIGEFCHPWGVAITPEHHILVADVQNKRIQKFFFDGTPLMTTDAKQLRLGFPTILHPTTSNVYVSDSEKHRIVVLHPDLTFFHSIGSRGSEPGQFQSPHGIAVDTKGILYVADQLNRRIQKLSLAGNYISSWSKPLQQPYGICINMNNIVYVSDNTALKVFIFTSCGECLGSFGQQDQLFKSLRSLAITESGNLVICDAEDSSILIY